MNSRLDSDPAAILAAETRALNPREPAPASKPDAFEPWSLYCVDLRGLNVTPPSANPWTTRAALTLKPGQEVEVTPELIEANADRYGRSWITFTDEEQHDAWGMVRFGRVGDSKHEAVLRATKLTELADAKAELNAARIMNPRARTAVGAAGRISRLHDRVADLKEQTRDDDE